MKKWRHIYSFFCQGCSKKRFTLKFQRSKVGICRICRKNKVDEKQSKLL